MFLHCAEHWHMWIVLHVEAVELIPIVHVDVHEG